MLKIWIKIMYIHFALRWDQIVNIGQPSVVTLSEPSWKKT
jgi:hypothetical protein